jgi:hypothetical protein
VRVSCGQPGKEVLVGCPVQLLILRAAGHLRPVSKLLILGVD